MTKDVVKNTTVIFQALNDSQQVVKIRWAGSRLMILRGIPGGGKTFIALAMALTDIKNKSCTKLLLCRPAVECGESLGFLPGTLDEKILPWMMPVNDVLSDMSYAKLEDFPIELVSAGMLRGRTVKNATLIVDEAQNLTYAQLKCIVTRIGKGGKVILCGDPLQSDLNYSPNPLDVISKKLAHLDGCCVVNFTARDQIRDPFVNAVIEALGE